MCDWIHSSLRGTGGYGSSYGPGMLMAVVQSGLLATARKQSPTIEHLVDGLSAVAATDLCAVAGARHVACAGAQRRGQREVIACKALAAPLQPKEVPAGRGRGVEARLQGERAH